VIRFLSLLISLSLLSCASDGAVCRLKDGREDGVPVCAMVCGRTKAITIPRCTVAEMPTWNPQTIVDSPMPDTTERPDPSKPLPPLPNDQVR